MTTGERLVALAGAGGTAGALLLMIGAGSTSGEALVNYSGLPSGTAEQHLLADGGSMPNPSVNGWIVRARRMSLR